MKVKEPVLDVLMLVMAFGMLIPSFFLLSMAVSSFDETAPYFSVPKIIDEADLKNHNNKIVWLYGTLTPHKGKPFIWSPYSETGCLYYYSEKRIGSWETDSEGKQYWKWTTSENKINAASIVLSIGTREIALESSDASYYNLKKTANTYKTIDGVYYNFVEYIIPVENKTWILGTLGNDMIGKTDRGLFISLSSPESIIRYFREHAILFLFFSILCFTGGAGFSSVFVFRLLQKKKSFFRPLDLGMAFLSLGLFWGLAGLLSLSFSTPSLLEKILTIIIMLSTIGVFISSPLVMVGCRPRTGPFFIFFIPAIGLVLLGSWFLYNSFYTFSNTLLLLTLGILCLTLAVALVQIYRLIFARETQTGDVL